VLAGDQNQLRPEASKNVTLFGGLHQLVRYTYCGAQSAALRRRYCWSANACCVWHQIDSHLDAKSAALGGPFGAGTQIVKMVETCNSVQTVLSGKAPSDVITLEGSIAIKLY
jgi:hypothetical protein